MKFIHVGSAMVWIGGLVALVVLNARLAGAGEPAVRAAMGQQSGQFGRTVIGPSMGLTLLAGFATAGSAGFPFSSLWIVWGMLGWVLSILIGVVAVNRTATELGAAARSAAPGDPRVADLGRRLGVLNGVNLVILATVVWAMVFKPTL
jgi:uncharacterized membrane protein